MHSRVLPDLVEAAARSGDRVVADDALHTLETRAAASGTPWALGLAARSAALLAADGDAEALYQGALARLMRLEPSATSPAHGCSTASGSAARSARPTPGSSSTPPTRRSWTWEPRPSPNEPASSSRRPVSTPDQRSVETASDLTPQERQIARLAAGGDTNAEIAARLYISARTVDYHLRKVYQKLDIGSRRDLRHVAL